jgi:hypothetical protein
MRCRPVSVSVGRLIEFLAILAQDVSVTIRPSPTPATGIGGSLSLLPDSYRVQRIEQ